MKEETIKKIAELVENEELDGILAEANSVDEIVSILNDNGIEVTVDEIANVCGTISASGELCEASLEAVAGGGSVWSHIKSFLKGLASGLA